MRVRGVGGILIGVKKGGYWLSDHQNMGNPPAQASKPNWVLMWLTVRCSVEPQLFKWGLLSLAQTWRVLPTVGQRKQALDHRRAALIWRLDYRAWDWRRLRLASAGLVGHVYDRSLKMTLVFFWRQLTWNSSLIQGFSGTNQLVDNLLCSVLDRESLREV